MANELVRIDSSLHMYDLNDLIYAATLVPLMGELRYGPSRARHCLQFFKAPYILTALRTRAYIQGSSRRYCSSRYGAAETTKNSVTLRMFEVPGGHFRL